MEYNDLTPEQKARAKECKTPEELMALAKEEGVELSDTQLETIAGGDGWRQCPLCHAHVDETSGGASGSW